MLRVVNLANAPLITRPQSSATSVSDTLRATLLTGKSLIRTDGGEVLISPSGAERQISEFFRLDNLSKTANDIAKILLENCIKNKKVLVVPGYSTNPFLFRLLEAKEVVAADADPVSIECQKLIRDYFYHDSIGEILMSQAWYPTIDSCFEVFKKLQLPKGDGGRKQREEDILSRLRKIIIDSPPLNPLNNIDFICASLGTKHKEVDSISKFFPTGCEFDFIYVPYLLGIQKGIEDKESIKKAFEELWLLAKNDARIMITPFSNSADDHISLFESKANPGIVQKLEGLLPPNKFVVESDIRLSGSDASCVVLKVLKEPAKAGS